MAEREKQILEIQGFPASGYRHVEKITRHMRSRITHDSDREEDKHLQAIMRSYKQCKDIVMEKQLLMSPRR